MSFKDISYLELGWPLFGGVEPFCAILVEGLMRSNSVKLFQIRTSSSRGDVVKWHLLSRALAVFCSAERNHMCNLVEDIMRNNSV